MYCKVLPSKVAIRLPNNNSWSRARAAAGSPAEFRVVEATKGREDKPIERYRERETARSRAIEIYEERYWHKNRDKDGDMEID